ncbi:MAG TPA: T9SS type A sorting domain-containing protein, partial [Bacteroidia bacterium]|nr:T9SS type A sorting domain-containing protein [Bacteroidia bacterium]
KNTSVYNNINGPGWDTFGFTLYTWAGNQVASIEAHSMTGPGSNIWPINRFEYAYNNGKPGEVMVYDYDTIAQQFEPISFYRHYYTNNLMTAMVSGDDIGAGLQNTDSVSLTYLTNGNLDSGYQFAPLGNGWETAARLRLLFRKINTGIAQVAPVVNAVGVYPNPVADYLSVDIETVKDGNITLQVTDMTGKTIKTINAVNLPAGKNTIKVSALDMAPGVYFITCGNSSVKVVKE